MWLSKHYNVMWLSKHYNVAPELHNLHDVLKVFNEGLLINYIRSTDKEP